MPSDQTRDLLQLISEGFVFVDSHFRVLEMNAESERIENRPAAEIVGKTMWEAWPDLEDNELGRLWRSSMRDQKPVSLEHRYTWPDGRQAWIEMRAFPSDQGLAIFYRDVSDKKWSEEQLRQAQAELIHASRTSAMGAMAAALAHELAQPLTAVGNYVEAAARMLRPLPAAEAGEARRALNMAEAAVRRSIDLLRRLRAFVAKGQVEAENQDLQAIIADAGVLVLPHAQREGVELDFQLDPRARWVHADAVQIQQVLINLIKNAIDAMHESAERRVAVSTAADPSGAIAVEVADTGPGFGASAPDKLFAPFHSSKAHGLGIGLSISRAIVEGHGGMITARERPGGGAVFRFTLPRGQAPD